MSPRLSASASLPRAREYEILEQLAPLLRLSRRRIGYGVFLFVAVSVSAIVLLRSSSPFGFSPAGYSPRLTLRPITDESRMLTTLEESVRKCCSLPKQEAKTLSKHIYRESLTLRLDPLFVAALIRHESSFRRSAVSSAGARGLMQVLPSTARYIAGKRGIRWTGTKTLHESQYNIRLGLEYLLYLEKRFRGDWEKILMAYNWGPGSLENALKKKKRIPRSVQDYAKRIVRTHLAWRKA
jgi:hypothetical protein